MNNQPLTMTAKREAEIDEGICCSDASDLRRELHATRASLNASERFKNPWTVEVLNQVSGHWVDFCLDAPLLLADAEERERMLQAEQPKAKFRIVPWLNSHQRQFVQKQNDASEQTIQ